MGARASVSNRYDYSESTEIAPEAVKSALLVAEKENKEEERALEKAKPNFLATPFYHKHPFVNYRFDKKIGEGAFSTVYKATQISPDGQIYMRNFSKVENEPNWRPVRFAIKEIVLQGLTVQQLLNVQREVQFLSQLNHPYIVRMHAVYSPQKADGITPQEKSIDKFDLVGNPDLYSHLFVVLEYLQGGELLKAVCQRKRYNEDDARDLLLQIFEGLQHIHSRGLIHRDIKPENLILSTKKADNKIKIVDFGFAMLAEDGANSVSNTGDTLPSTEGKQTANVGVLCGTPGYMAPEVLKSRYYTTKCDMWAAGVVMFILLSGTMPFDVTDTKAQMKGQFAFASTRWITVTDSAKDLVSSLLKVNPRVRLSATQALEHPWMKKGTKVHLLPIKSVCVPIAIMNSPNNSISSTKENDVSMTSNTQVPLTSSVTEEPLSSELANAATAGNVTPSNTTRTGLTPTSSEIKLEVGDLTHNLQTLRQLLARRKFKKGLAVVKSAIRFKNLGFSRGSRRGSDVGLQSGFDLESLLTSQIQETRRRSDGGLVGTPLGDDLVESLSSFARSSGNTNQPSPLTNEKNITAIREEGPGSGESSKVTSFAVGPEQQEPYEDDEDDVVDILR